MKSRNAYSKEKRVTRIIILYSVILLLTLIVSVFLETKQPENIKEIKETYYKLEESEPASEEIEKNYTYRSNTGVIRKNVEVILTYNVNGGAEEIEPITTYKITQTTISGSTDIYCPIVILSQTIPTRSGYEFGGWYSEEECINKIGDPGDEYVLNEDVTLYAKWTLNTTDGNVSYTVNHYIHDLGQNVYTLYKTETLKGESGANITIRDLAKQIDGFTYSNAYFNGDTTKPSSGAKTTVTLSTKTARTINIYYRRNYLCIEYDANGGEMTPNTSYKLEGSLVATTKGASKFLRGVYGSTVNNITTTENKVGSSGLHNVATLKLTKTGYKVTAAKAYNTEPDGSGMFFSQTLTTYNANDFAGVNLAEEDQVVRLYVNWIPVTYKITYNLNGGTNAKGNPTKYTIESNTLELKDPVKQGCVFAGWTTEIVKEPTVGLLIPKGSYGNITVIANWESTSSLILQGKNNSYFLGNNERGNGEVTKDKIEKITFDEDATCANRTAWDVSAENNGSILAWYEDIDKNGLYEVIIGSNYGKVIANKDSSNLFSFIGMNNSIEIKGLKNFDISKVENMDRMFYGCKNLQKIDISDWDTSTVTSMSEMFAGCSKLSRIYVGDKWSIANITASDNMFKGCIKLRGINGITFDSASTDATFAKFEGGYLTHINNKEEVNLGTNGIEKRTAKITAKNKDVEIEYWIYVPEISDVGTYDDIPLIVYLHGDKDNLTTYTADEVANYSLPKYLKDGDIKPNAIIIAPCRKSVYFADWGQYYIPELVRQIKREYETIDSNRIAITGHSTGANSTIVAAAENPGLFSACVPVSYRYGNLLASYGPKIDCPIKLVFESQGASTWITKAKTYINSNRKKQDVSYETVANTSHGTVVEYYKTGLIDWIISKSRVQEVEEEILETLETPTTQEIPTMQESPTIQDTPTTQETTEIPVSSEESDLGGIELINGNVKYWRYIPKLADIGTYKKIPLIVYLHGGSSSERDANCFDVTGYSLPKYLKDGTLKVNAIVVNPVSYSQSSIIELINALKTQYDIDENNISITGHSTGAYTAFSTALKYQDVFFCCVPVSLRYQGSYANIKNITKCDLRFIFESNFGGSPKSETEMKNIKKEVDRLNTAGVPNIIQYETIPDTTHNGATKCYNEELIGWILGNRKK
ncbi:MAG: InlB B-repeat-containing protein [Clostridia bacterium]|nr:InlB B-repeat-containing protein [Clostridia bacterium]